MTKIQFLFALKERLAGLPQAEVEERLTFYSEMIEDRMEEGLSEEEAVAAVGSVEQIAGEIPAVKEAEKPKRKLKPWERTLLIAGSPLWLALLIAAAAVVLAVYVSAWAVIVSLWAIFGALIGCALGGIAGGVIMVAVKSEFAGIALIGAGIVCAGLAILMHFGCKAATKGLCRLTKKLFTYRRETK